VTDLAHPRRTSPVGKPWNAEGVPAGVLDPIGMIGPEERRALHWIAREWTGDGAIVDAGSYLGASAFCLAAGVAASGRRARGPVIHAYDRFRADDEYVAEAITRAARPTARGDSYLDLFHAQTARHAELIRAIPGDFLEARWTGGDIDVLFVDIAKTPELNAHLVGEFFPALVPGRSLLVQQDWYHCWHPHIHVTMEYLADEFELADEHIEHQSRLWALRQPIPAAKIGRLARRELPREERRDLLDRLVDRSSPRFRPMAEAIRAWQDFLDGDLDAARRGIAALRQRFPLETTNELWARQAIEIEAEIARRERSAAVPAPSPREEHAEAVREAARRHGYVAGRFPASGRDEGRSPDFLVIGPPKSGTTWLYRQLQSHPEVWVPPIKELNFLNERFVPAESRWTAAMRRQQVDEFRRFHPDLADERLREALLRCEADPLDLAGYRAIFASADADQTCGEVSPNYCHLPRRAIASIVAMNPGIRVVSLLRDPVERAISHLRMEYRKGHVRDPASEAWIDLDLEPFVAGSNYPGMIARWGSMLPAGQFRVLDYGLVGDRPMELLDDLCGFLGILPDPRLFPFANAHIGSGSADPVHPALVAELRSRLAHVYDAMGTIVPDLAAGWRRPRSV